MKPFEIISQGQTVQMQSTGKTLPELFCNAAYGMFSALAGDGPRTGKPFNQQIAVRSVDEETLMVDWLSKLYELALIENVYINNISISSLGDGQLTAQVEGLRGAGFDNDLGVVSLDDFTINETAQGFTTKITFK